MNLLVLALALGLPASVAGGALRGLLEKPSPLQPLQRPPPATADVAFAQLQIEGPAAAPASGPASAPYGAPGPAPVPAAMPTEPNIPKITSDTCKKLEGKVNTLIGGAGGPGPAPAPAAFLQDVAGGAPAAATEGPNVECKVYAWVSKKPAGCTCFVEAPPPPAPQPKVPGCPQIPDALAMGFTGNVVQEGPMAFGGQTGGFVRHTCVYRQWFYDPTLEGVAKDYQIKLSDARTEKYIKDTYKASMNNAHNTAKAFWALTPVPWLKLYPTTPWPASGPAPAAAPAPGPAGFPTTPPILHFTPPPTTPPPFGSPFGSPFGTPPPFGAPPAFGAPPGVPTTAPVYAAVGFR